MSVFSRCSPETPHSAIPVREEKKEPEYISIQALQVADKPYIVYNACLKRRTFFARAKKVRKETRPLRNV